MDQTFVEQNIGRLSTMIYLPISFGVALAFLLAASLSGSYSLVEKIGGTMWVGLISLIVSMPLVTSSVKHKLQPLR